MRGFWATNSKYSRKVPSHRNASCSRRRSSKRSLILNCFLPSCSCIALKPLRPSRIGQRVGRGHAIYSHRNVFGNGGFFLSVLRDTPHARVSVSYVLEASLLNDRFQLEVRWELEANCTRASLRGIIAQGSMLILLTNSP